MDMAVVPKTFEEQPAPPPNCLGNFWAAHRKSIVVASASIVGAVVLSLLCFLEYLKISRFDLEKSGIFYNSNIDSMTHPCENFYQFTCGSFITKNKEKTNGSFSTITNMEKSVSDSLKNVLSEPIDPSDSAALRKLKSFYSICLNKKKIVAEGNKPMLQLLHDIGGWPLIDKNHYNRTDSWVDVVGRVNRVGLGSFFPFKLSENSSRFTMSLYPMLSDERQHSYNAVVNLIAHVTKWLVGTNFDFRLDIRRCASFESALFKITNSAQIAHTESHTLTTLMEKYPRFPWQKYFENVFIDTNVKIRDNDTVHVVDPGYISRVLDLLERMSIKTITNYIVWRAIEVVVHFTPLDLENAPDDFCLETLFEEAPLAMGSVYLDRFFDKKIKEVALPIFENIRSEAYLYINELKWIDSRVKKNMLERLTSLKPIFGSSDENLGVEFVREFLEGWDVERNASTLSNFLNLLKMHRRSRIDRHMMLHHEEELIVPIELFTSIGAGHMVSTSSIFFVAALLQRPFIAVDQPMYLNYGGIGFRMAHDISHDLNLLSECQNSNCTGYEEFWAKKTCTEDIYSRYPMKQPNETFDGTRNLEGNVGDVLGVMFAYRAYEKWVNQSWLSERVLPGLNLTARQTFWLNLATSYCTYRTDDELMDFMATDLHSLEETRINVALANMKEFSEDFGCPEGSKMNPAEKCDFWFVG